MFTLIRQYKAGMLLYLVLASNLVFFASCFFSPSAWVLVLVFSLESVFLMKVKWREASMFYSRFGLMMGLLRVSLYAYIATDQSGVMIFILLEMFLLPVYETKYFLKYFASSLPMRNFTNVGKLDDVRRMFMAVGKYSKALYLRSALYALLMLLVIFSAQVLIGMLFMVMIVLSAIFYYKLLNLLLYLNSKMYESDLAEQLATHAPKVLVYVSGSTGSAYQLSQWLPVLEQLKFPVMVITRELFWTEDLPENKLYTVYARGMKDLDNFCPPSAKVCLYPANGFKNAQMMRQIQIKHIFINHGESDKVVNQSRFLGAYNKLYLAGPMAKERLDKSGIHLADKQIAFVGRPQTSIFIRQTNKKTGKILYAPTWEGYNDAANYTSVEMALEIVQTITKQTSYDCVFKPHPLTGNIKRKLRHKLSEIREYLFSRQGSYHEKGNVLKLMNDCDLLITDISSVMNDFLCTGKPYIVTNFDGPEVDDFLAKYQTAKGGYVLANIDELPDIVEEATGSDPSKEQREVLRQHSLGSISIDSLQRFNNELNRDVLDWLPLDTVDS